MLYNILGCLRVVPSERLTNSEWKEHCLSKLFTLLLRFLQYMDGMYIRIRHVNRIQIVALTKNYI